MQKIRHDILVNNRCLQEETNYFVKRILELWIEYDKGLLEMVKSVSNSREELIDYAIDKLTELQTKAHCEDRQRGKARYVKKTQAYQDLIDLLKEMEKCTG